MKRLQHVAILAATIGFPEQGEPLEFQAFGLQQQQALAAYTPVGQTMTTVRNRDTNLVGQTWKTAMLLQADHEDDLSSFSGGPGSGKPIIEHTDLTKGGGDTINFSVSGDLGGSGRRGDDVLEGYTETILEGTFSVVIDQIRHGVNHTQLVKFMKATGASLEEAEVTLLGQWLGRKKKHETLLKWIKSATSANTVRPDGKTRDQLLSTDTVSTAFLEEAAGAASTVGADPCEIGKDQSSGADVYGHCFIGTLAGLRPLKSDDTYNQAVAYSDVRGDGNVRFAGGFKMWDANVIYQTMDRDRVSYGPLGTPLAPKAKLGDAAVDADGTTGLTTGAIDLAKTNALMRLYGAGIIQASLGDYSSYFEPFAYFPGYDYSFYKKQVAAPDASTRYLLIYDPADNKWTVAQYTGSNNTGSQIIIGDRLAAATATNRKTTLLGFTYNSAVNKETFAVGSWIFPVNVKGVPLAFTILTGRASLMRAWGSPKMQRLSQERDFGEQQGSGIKSVYGQNVSLDPNGAIRGYMLIETAAAHPGIRFPQVTS